MPGRASRGRAPTCAVPCVPHARPPRALRGGSEEGDVGPVGLEGGAVLLLRGAHDAVGEGELQLLLGPVELQRALALALLVW